MVSKIFASLLVILLCGVWPVLSDAPSSYYNYKLAFGSCFHHRTNNRDSGIFKAIKRTNPDAWLWLGDMAYLDDPIEYPLIGAHGFKFTNTEERQKRFNESKFDPLYQEMIQQDDTKVYGIWDDHDYGIDNGNKNNPVKEEVRKMFLEAIDEPKDSKRWTRKGGIYESYFLDEQKNIKLILLDDRYNKDDPKDESIPYEEKSDLGLEQEEWYVKELTESTAHFTIVAFGTKVMADDRLLFMEVPYPRTKRLLLTTANPNTKIVLITGDVHFAEINVDMCTKHVHGYPISEFTSSGLTHTFIYDFGHLSGPIMDFLFPDTYNRAEDRYLDLNFGLLEFFINPSDRSKSSLLTSINDYRGYPRIVRHMKDKFFKQQDQPDWPAYKKCLEDRGTGYERQVANFKSILTNLKHPFPYIAFTIFVVLSLCLWVSWKIFWFVVRLTGLGKKKAAGKAKDE